MAASAVNMLASEGRHDPALLHASSELGPEKEARSKKRSQQRQGDARGGASRVEGPEDCAPEKEKERK